MNFTSVGPVRVYMQGHQPISDALLRRVTARHAQRDIVLSYDYPPIPERNLDWSATDWDIYDGAPDAGHQYVGHGRTAEEALRDLLEQLEADETPEEAVTAGATPLQEAAESAARCMRMAATLLRDASRPQASLALLAAAVDLERAIGIKPADATAHKSEAA